MLKKKQDKSTEDKETSDRISSLLTQSTGNNPVMLASTDI